MKKRKRLIWRLFPSYLLITLISLLAVSWYASEAMRHFFLDQTATDLKARAALLEKQIKGYLAPLNADAIDSICKEAGRLSATRITVILPDGTVIGRIRQAATNSVTYNTSSDIRLKTNIKATKYGLNDLLQIH